MKKTIIRILLALIIGSALFAFENALVDKENDYEFIEIYYSKSNIEVNDILEGDDLKTVRVPKKYVYGNYIEIQNIIEGRRADQFIEAGTMISQRMLQDGQSSYPIEPQKEDNRLITIRFNEVNGNGFMIQKNQYVDLVYVSESDQASDCIRLENVVIREIIGADKGEADYIYVCFEVSKAVDEFLIRSLPQGRINISIRKEG